MPIFSDNCDASFLSAFLFPTTECANNPNTYLQYMQQSLQQQQQIIQQQQQQIFEQAQIVSTPSSLGSIGVMSGDCSAGGGGVNSNTSSITGGGGAGSSLMNYNMFFDGAFNTMDDQALVFPTSCLSSASTASVDEVVDIVGGGGAHSSRLLSSGIIGTPLDSNCSTNDQPGTFLSF